MVPNWILDSSFSQDFHPFIIDFIKPDFMNSSFKFVAHFIDILQSLYGKECIYGRFKSFFFVNGFQDGNDPVFFPIMISDIFFKSESFTFKKLSLCFFDLYVHYFIFHMNDEKYDPHILFILPITFPQFI